jgi:hypothetical protein
MDRSGIELGTYQPYYNYSLRDVTTYSSIDKQPTKVSEDMQRHSAAYKHTSGKTSPL